MRDTTLEIPAESQPDRKSVGFTCLDYYDRQVVAGQGEIVNGTFRCELKLPSGFYWIVPSFAGPRIGIFAAADFQGERDPFFGLDTAMSWLMAGTRKNHRSGLANVMRRNGIAAVRERIAWGDITPDSNKTNWNPPHQQYDQMRKIYIDAGLEVLDLYHEAPSWTGAGNRNKNTNPYPTDTAAVANCWKTMADRWGDNWCGWEIWNEPDIGFGGNLPADQYLPLVKTIAITAAGRTGKKTELMGLVSANDMPGEFHELCARNGLFLWVDGISYHSYNPGIMLENSIAAYRDWMKRHGAGNMPLWITESGFSSVFNQEGSAMNRNLRQSALNVALKAVEAKACGISRYFPFVFSYYNEGAADFSMLDATFSPRPATAAYFTAVRLLAGKKYVGDLSNADKEIKRARIFAGPAGDAVVAVLTEPDQPTAVPPFPFKYRLIRIDGSNAPSGTTPGQMYYLSTTLKELQNRINTDTTAVKLRHMAEAPTAKQQASNDFIVIQPRPAVEKHTAAGYYLREEEGDNFMLPVNITNLSNIEKSVHLRLRVQDKTGKILEEIAPPQLNIASGATAQSKNKIELKKWLRQYQTVEVTIAANDEDPVIMRFHLDRPEIATAVPKGTTASEISFARQDVWLSQGALWYGTDDLNCRFSVNWTPDRLFITVKVKDNIHSQDFSAENMWRGDSLQLAIQKLQDNRKPDLSGTTQLCIGKTAQGEMVYPDRIRPGSNRKQLMSGIKTAIVQEEVELVYHLEIPVAILGIDALSPGMELGFSLLINDNDGYGRKGCMFWGEGIARYNGNPATYFRLNIANEQQPLK